MPKHIIYFFQILRRIDIDEFFSFLMDDSLDIAVDQNFSRTTVSLSQK
jgi:hypothetical protein